MAVADVPGVAGGGGPLMSWPALTRRSFIAAAASTAIAGARTARAASPQSALNVRDLGAIGDGVHDDSAPFAAALERARSVYVPAGTYLVDRIMVPASRTLATDGFATCFRQRPGLPQGTRLLNVIGSNVRIGSCTVEGNIATDQDEQFHGIYLNASDETGDIANVEIGDVRGANLRGDVVCITCQAGRVARNVSVGHVHGQNILRNVVSIVGGEAISVSRVTGSGVGLMHLDIEPDDYNGPVIGCSVGSVIGGFVQAAGSSAFSFLDQIRIGLLDLRGPVAPSSPIYKHSKARRDALTVRNYRTLEIQQLKVRGFQGAAVRQIWDPGALQDQRLHIVRAELSDCCRDPKAARAYIVGNARATRLHVDDLAIAIGRPGIDAVHDCRAARIDRLHGKLPKGSRLVAQSDSWIERLMQQAGPTPLLFVPNSSMS